MPITAEAADGTPVDVEAAADEINSQFDSAMNGDPAPDVQAPPRRAPKPPADPDAPTPKRGRPPKAEKARTTSTAAVVLTDDQRTEGVKGWAQIGAALALMMGKATKKDAYKADAITIKNAAGDFAEACVATAHADANFAATLDKVCAVGPYGALITVAVGVGSQCARNHKPELSIPGTVDPAELLKDETKETANAG